MSVFLYHPPLSLTIYQASVANCTFTGSNRSNIQSHKGSPPLHPSLSVHEFLICSYNDFPEFPTISYELGYRKTVDKETQQKIIAQVKKISYHVSPRIWLGIKWLSTYISIRPNELRNIKESHIDLKQGFIFIPHPKEKRPKYVPLVQDDIEYLESLPRAFPEMYFFRHGKGIKGVQEGRQFGTSIFYTWWKRACKDLGIEGIDLYGGTRHSSAADLRNYATPEQIKRATMHTTNKTQSI